MFGKWKCYKIVWWIYYIQKTRQYDTLFSIWGFSHENSRTTETQGKGEGISLTPHYHFHPFHIYWAITAESSPLHIASSRTGTALPLVSECNSLTTKLLALDVRFSFSKVNTRRCRTDYEYGNLLPYHLIYTLTYFSLFLLLSLLQSYKITNIPINTEITLKDRVTKTEDSVSQVKDVVRFKTSKWELYKY